MSHGSQIAAFARQAARDRARVRERALGECDPDEAEAYLRDGAGRAIWLYVEGRTGGRLVRFSPAEFDALERAMNDWFECYARCYGVEIDASFTLREAAELLLETRNIHDVGQLLTGVPDRSP
ncbi:hypothetical protein [Halovivax gelatinilyticus]|uniref:hypothetical protein n=1 Tax=Halovivax gelatinilyticus TaxID=2961597 RepID=UPI0020CA273B|nr:hypothetical protein [Halovivax gelatinilyticus]